MKVPEPDWVRTTTIPPGDEVAVYESIVAPPFEAGAVKVRETVVAFTTVAVPIVGAPGAVTPPPPPPPDPRTSIVKFVLVVFCEFAAETTYVADAVAEVGVPEIVPLVTLKFRPAGSAGETDQVVTEPPLFVAVKAVMAVPTFALRVVAE